MVLRNMRVSTGERRPTRGHGRLVMSIVALMVGACSIERSAYYADKGTGYAEQGRHVDAAEAFQESIRLSPAWSAPRIELGKSLWALGRYDEAVASYREALRLKPSDPEAKGLLEQAEAALSPKTK
jgi:tetratricopeptide (TPR) repeat protein